MISFIELQCWLWPQLSPSKIQCFVLAYIKPKSLGQTLPAITAHPIQRALPCSHPATSDIAGGFPPGTFLLLRPQHHCPLYLDSLLPMQSLMLLTIWTQWALSPLCTFWTISKSILPAQGNSASPWAPNLCPLCPRWPRVPLNHTFYLSNDWLSILLSALETCFLFSISCVSEGLYLFSVFSSPKTGRLFILSLLHFSASPSFRMSVFLPGYILSHWPLFGYSVLFALIFAWGVEGEGIRVHGITSIIILDTPHHGHPLSFSHTFNRDIICIT